MHATATLSSTTVRKAWSRPPISMDFTLSMFTSSGIVVRYLKIFEKSNYNTVKWVRYLVRAGSYEIRVSIDVLLFDNIYTSLLTAKIVLSCKSFIPALMLAIFRNHLKVL